MIRKHGKIILLAFIFVVFTGISGYSFGKLQGINIEKEKIISKEAQEKKKPAPKEKKEKDKEIKTVAKEEKKKPVKDDKKKEKKKRERPSIPVASPSVIVGQASERLSSNVSTPKGLKDGEYAGAAQAYAGPIRVRVKIANGKIKNIQVVEHRETPKYYSMAYATIDRILDAQSLKVDSTSGATITSEAIKVATYNALRQAMGSEEALDLKDLGLPTVENNQQKDLDEIKLMLKSLLDSEKQDQEVDQIKDGLYKGQGRGYKSNIQVQVEVKDKKISNIKVLGHGDDQSYFSKAEKVLDSIVEKQSTKVDMITGATFSSRGIKVAVNNALKEAGSGSPNQELEELTVNIDKLLKDNEDMKDQMKAIEDQLAKQDDEMGANTELEDGVYKGQGRGYKSNILVKLLVKDKKISSIQVLGHNEDEPYFSRAKTLINDIISKQSTKVDVVTTATRSSKGILSAVNNALKKAGRSDKEDSNEKLIQLVESLVEQNEKLNEKMDGLEKDLAEQTDEITSLLEGEKILEDGTYKGQGRGYKSNIQVEVVVKDHKISSIKILDQDEDAEYFSKAEKILDVILEKQTTEVDLVTSATKSSRGIQSAVKQALRKAKKNPGVDNSIEKDLQEQIKELEEKNKEQEKIIQEQAKKIEELLNEKNPPEPKPPAVEEKIEIPESKKTGTWTGEAWGHKGLVKVEVKTEEGKIADLKVLEQVDDRQYLSIAMDIKDLLLKDDFLGTLKVFREYAKLTDLAEEGKVDQLPEKLQAQMLGWTIPKRQPVDTKFTDKLSKEIRDYIKNKDEKATIQFDAVSGATRTAKGISEAVRKAITEEKKVENIGGETRRN